MIEKIILRNFTRLCFYSIFLLIAVKIIEKILFWEKYNFIFTFIDIKDLIIIIWAIIAFWYWFKRYERDKELEIIDKYAKKYNDINNELYHLKIKFKNENQNNELKDKIKRNYIDLCNLFYEEFYLKSNWYISEQLWNEWSEWIEIDISDFLSYSIYNLFSLEDNDIFISLILWNYLQQYDKNKNIKNNWLTYLEYIIEIINKIQRDFEIELKNKVFNNKDKEYNKKMKELVDWTKAINITLKNEIKNLKQFNNLRNLPPN